MTTRSNKLEDVPVGHRFLHNMSLYLRIKNLDFLTENYQPSVTVLSLDNYEVMIMNSNYQVDEIVEKEEIVYE